MSALPIAEAQAEPLLRFVEALRRRHARAAALGAAVQTTLTLAVPAIALAWLLPTWRLGLACALLGLVAVRALVAAQRGRRTAPTQWLADAGVSAACSAPRLRELGDELATWVELQGRAERPAMLGWLQADVAARVPQLGPANLAPVGRRRFGDVLWLLPLALVLLLAWWLAEWLAPPWSGALNGGGGQRSASSGGGGANGGGAGGGAPESDPSSPPEKGPPPDAPPTAPEPDAPPSQPEPPESATPPPLLDLPLRQQFLLPEFLGDGPTRRVRMHTAEVDDGPAPRTQRPQRVGDAPTAPAPAPDAERFERALEQALGARHVPPAERAMVKRFFEGLRQASR